jgi:hypothetical protein
MLRWKEKVGVGWRMVSTACNPKRFFGLGARLWPALKRLTSPAPALAESPMTTPPRFWLCT